MDFVTKAQPIVQSQQWLKQNESLNLLVIQLKQRFIQNADTNTNMENIVKDIVDSYGGVITIEDGDLVVNGMLITDVELIDNELHYYAGNMTTDKFAEEVYPDNAELDLIHSYIIDEF